MKIVSTKLIVIFVLAVVSVWLTHQNTIMMTWPRVVSEDSGTSMHPLAQALSIGKLQGLDIDYEGIRKDKLSTTHPVSIESFNRWLEQVSLVNLEPVSLNIVPAEEYGLIMANDVRF